MGTQKVFSMVYLNFDNLIQNDMLGVSRTWVHKNVFSLVYLNFDNLRHMDIFGVSKL